jgi:tRNA A37 threonylcarbamoyladenosine synthetase subunit TsaC/SUA5/YrdC
VLDAGAVDGSGATTVDITEPDWKIIRQGAVPEAAIRETLQSQEF